MKCPFGNCIEVKEWDNDISQHLVVTKDSVNHIHVHGPLDKPKVVEEFAQAIYSHAGMTFPETSTQSNVPDKIIFKNRQAIGDILVMTCAVRDFAKAFPDTRLGVITTAMHLWDNNPYIDHNFKDEEFVLDVGPGALTNMSNRDNRHHCNSFRVDIENKLGVRFDQGDIRPDIWMTREEYEKPPLIEGPYWVMIIGGEPGWTAKMYPADRWQEVINSLKDDIQIVQLGMSRHPYPHLENCIDYIGKTEDKDTGIRDLFNIFLHAQGSVGLVSMHMHLSAAFNNCCVVVAGAREPAWFTHYFGHQYLQTNGCLHCGIQKACWKCDVNACADATDGIPKCVDLIHPQEIVSAIRRYYQGGRLKYGEKVKNDFFKNIAGEEKVYVAPKPSGEAEKYGMVWGGANVTETDWKFIKRIVGEKKPKSILQFGADLATLLLMNETEKLVVYETDGQKMQDIRKMVNNRVELRNWDGLSVKDKLPQFDLAFVDAPPGGKNREFSTKIASLHADNVIIHDANREWEKKWQEKYLKGKFQFARKGGSRCNYWTKQPMEIANLDMSQPLVRLISTARGWGGCARSITTIMKMLTDQGIRVEFIPFHGKFETGAGIGSEFRNWLNTDGQRVKVGNYHDIKRECDVTFVYADDYVWEFSQAYIINVFSNLNTKRRVMMLNFRRGKVGEIEWTKGWDLYMGLNSGQMKDLKKVLPDANTCVLPPCTDLSEFFKVTPNYDMPLRLVRLSSQGDVKFRKNEADAERFKKEVQSILDCRSDVEIHMMPGPTFMASKERVVHYPRNVPSPPEFLSRGNLFWYSLPEGYHDQGPRVVIEAMASGLPILADNWGGAVDRVTPKTGWLCNTKEQFVEIIKNVTMKELRMKGEAARKRAKKEFVPERWMEKILGEKFL